MLLLTSSGSSPAHSGLWATETGRVNWEDFKRCCTRLSCSRQQVLATDRSQNKLMVSGTRRGCEYQESAEKAREGSGCFSSITLQAAGIHGSTDFREKHQRLPALYPAGTRRGSAQSWCCADVLCRCVSRSVPATGYVRSRSRAEPRCVSLNSETRSLRAETHLYPQVLKRQTYLTTVWLTQPRIIHLDVTLIFHVS